MIYASRTPRDEFERGSDLAVLGDWDLIELPAGEILSVVGSYAGPVARARLAYLPDAKGELRVGGRPYRKVTYELSNTVHGAEQVLRLPGECHYLVPRGEIRRVYPTVEPDRTHPVVDQFARAFEAAGLNAPRLGGSWALGAQRKGSDYDWVTASHDVTAVEQAVAAAGARTQFHQGLDHVDRKFAHFVHLTAQHRAALMSQRWRHFQLDGIPMSVDFTTPDLHPYADRWLGDVHRCGRAQLIGEIVDAADAYFFPKDIRVRCAGQIVRVFTWLNLYTGAFRSGDVVEVLGEWAVIDKSDLRLREEAYRAVGDGAAEVFNLACDMGGMGFIENNKAACMLSVLASTHMLMAAKDAGVDRFFFSSSACVYPAYRQGQADLVALKEEDAYPADAEDGYGWEKLFTERTARHFREDHGLATRIARYHNVYGPNGSWTGGREKAPAAACRKVAEAVLSGNHEVEIWGDGEQTRSFMYVDDCVTGTLMLTRSEFVEPLNIGSAELVSINHLYALVKDIAGVKLTYRHVPGALGVRGRNSDNTLIQKEFDWEPSTRLGDGLEVTYRWIYDQVAASR